MFNVTGGEVVIILVLALVVLGPEKLPEMLRKAGRLYGELRRMSSGFQSEFEETFGGPLREFRETANQARDMIRNPLSDHSPVDQTPVDQTPADQTPADQDGTAAEAAEAVPVRSWPRATGSEPPFMSVISSGGDPSVDPSADSSVDPSVDPSVWAAPNATAASPTDNDDAGRPAASAVTDESHGRSQAGRSFPPPPPQLPPPPPSPPLASPPSPSPSLASTSWAAPVGSPGDPWSTPGPGA